MRVKMYDLHDPTTVAQFHEYPGATETNTLPSDAAWDYLISEPGNPGGIKVEADVFVEVRQ